MWQSISMALTDVVSLPVLTVMLISAVYGVLIGSMPGLTATMAVALLVPFTFFMDDISSIAAIVTLVTCSIFAGDLPSTLLRIPGTPASAAYASDAYALTRIGRHGDALRTCLYSSVAGGIFGSLVLIAAAPQLAQIAFLFTSYENFWLVVLGLSCAAVISHGSKIKGAVSLIIGLLFATVGLSEVHTIPRFTFRQDEMINGISFIPAMIGLFGGSEILRNFSRPEKVSRDEVRRENEPIPNSLPPITYSQVGWRDIWRRRRPALRSGSIGVLVGMLPGAGADIAAWVSYAISKRFSHHPEEYQHGSLEGIADATGANNAALAGAWIPALVFGIPGDSVTAIVIGVLLMKNVTPGPDIFQDPARSALVSSIYIVFLLANFLLIPIGLLAIRGSSVLIRIPRQLLFPAIWIVCIVGAYAMNGSYFDVLVMLGMAVLGFVLEEMSVPLGPLVLGIILGGRLEQTFIQSLIKSASLLDFVTRPLSAALAAACLLLWLGPAWVAWRRTRHSGNGSVPNSIDTST